MQGKAPGTPLTHPIEYHTRFSKFKAGEFTLDLETLTNLDKTIDELFDWLRANDCPEKLEELCPYFGVIWPSAQALCEIVARDLYGMNFRPHESGATKSVLELGCGLALPSMIGSLRGLRTTATDFHPDVPRFLKSNLERNPRCNLEFVTSDWRKSAPSLGKFDIVMASDVLYERIFAVSLANAIRDHLAPGGKVILTDPGRPYLQSFVDEMKAVGFACQTHAHTVWLDGAQGAKLKNEIFCLTFN